MRKPHDLEIDRLILSLTGTRWQKVAMTAARVLQDCDQKRAIVSNERFEDRLRALVVAGELDIIGDIENWRRSEIRRRHRGIRY